MLYCILSKIWFIVPFAIETRSRLSAEIAKSSFVQLMAWSKNQKPLMITYVKYYILSSFVVSCINMDFAAFLRTEVVQVGGILHRERQLPTRGANLQPRDWLTTVNLNGQIGRMGLFTISIGGTGVTQLQGQKQLGSNPGLPINLYGFTLKFIANSNASNILNACTRPM